MQAAAQRERAREWSRSPNTPSRAHAVPLPAGRLGFISHLDRPRFPSASLPLPAAPPLPGGRRPGCAGQEGRARQGVVSCSGLATLELGARLRPGLRSLSLRLGRRVKTRPAFCRAGWLRGGFYETILQALKPRLSFGWQLVVRGGEQKSGGGQEVTRRAGLGPWPLLGRDRAVAFASPCAGSHVGTQHCPRSLRASAYSLPPSPSIFGVSPEASPISDVFSPAQEAAPGESCLTRCPPSSASPERKWLP